MLPWSLQDDPHCSGGSQSRFHRNRPTQKNCISQKAQYRFTNQERYFSLMHCLGAPTTPNEPRSTDDYPSCDRVGAERALENPPQQEERLQTIQRALRFVSNLPDYMRIDHGCFHILMPQQLLYFPDIGS